jgi:antitoxin MazE
VQVRVQKWGNSLALRLPRPVALDARIEEGSVIDVRVVEGKLVAEPVGPRYALADLLRKVSRKNLHREIDAGGPVGREAW